MRLRLVVGGLPRDPRSQERWCGLVGADGAL